MSVKRSGQTRRGPVAVPDGRATAEHPAERLVAVQDPMLALKVPAAVRKVRRQRCLDPTAIVGMHAREPFLRRRADLRLVVAEHRLPASRPVDAVRHEIPVPQPVVGASNGEGIALLAVAEILDRPLAGHVRADPRQRHGKIDRLGHVVVRAQSKRLDDVGALRSGRHHDHGKLGVGAVGANPAQDLESAHARHLDVQQDEIECQGLDERQRFRAIRRHADDVATVAQAPGERVPVGFVVVDDQQRAGARHSAASVFSKRLDLLEQPLKADRLGVELVPAGGQRELAIVGHGVGAQHDDRDVAGGGVTPSTGEWLPTRR